MSSPFRKLEPAVQVPQERVALNLRGPFNDAALSLPAAGQLLALITLLMAAFELALKFVLPFVDICTP